MNPTLRDALASAKQTALGYGLSLLGQPAITRSARERLGHRGIVLMFHHVYPPAPTRLGANAGLEISPATLDHVLSELRAQDYDIVAMDEVPDRLARPRATRFAALTFDDGGRDLATLAVPVLLRHEAPFTIYVPTAFADGDGVAWWYAAERAALASPRLVLETPGGTRTIKSETWTEKQRAAVELNGILWSLSEPARAETVARVAAQTGLDLHALTRELYMSWDELAQIARVPGCTIGAHTLTHPKLTSLDEPDAAREIASPRAIFRERLGVDVRHIAYPFGGPEACGEREFALARAAGYDTGVTTRRGVLQDGDDLLRIERVPINGLFQADTMIDALVSGVPTMLERHARALQVRAAR